MSKEGKTKLILAQENTITDFDDLFQLWKDMPIVQKISDQDLFKATNHPIQKAILKILREGILDPNGRKRNFLTANELLDLVNKELEGIQKAIKISMLYYHLDKLIESQLVGYVYHIEGRHKRKYFGRTAKFYLFGDTNKEKQMIEKIFTPVSKLIKHFNPDTDIEEYRKIVNEMKETQDAFYDAIVTWMRRNHELLYELDIDALDLFTALSWFGTTQGPLKNLYQPLKSQMKFLE